jgi:hypothetical protein
MTTLRKFIRVAFFSHYSAVAALRAANASFNDHWNNAQDFNRVEETGDSLTDARVKSFLLSQEHALPDGCSV